MANTIITKNSSTASAVPTAGDLVQGELAVNVTDKRLFTEDSGGTVVELGTNPTTLAVAGNTTVGGTLGVTGVATLTANPTLSGGTANGVPYLNGSKVLTSGSALTFDGTNLATTGAVYGGNGLWVTGGSGTTRRLSFDASGVYYNWIDNDLGLMRFAIQNTEAMRLTSTGLGIGTSSPQRALHVNGAVGAMRLQGSSVGGYIEISGPSNTNYIGTPAAISSGSTTDLAFYVSSAERARITSSGNLLVGTTSKIGSDNRELSVNASTAGHSSGLVLSVAGTKVAGISAASTYTAFGSSTSAPLILQTGGTERARITSSGDLLVGTTSVPIQGATGTGIYGSAGRINIANNSSSATAMAFYSSTQNTGTITTTASTTAYNIASDYRLKENVTTLTGAADRVKALKPSRFNFIADPTKTVDGFLAHEAQAVVPEAVTGEKDAVDAEGNPIYQGIDQAKLVPLLTAALQEALARVESLESRLTAAGL